MGLFEKIAEIQHKLSDQLSVEQQSFLNGKVNNMLLARKEATAATKYINTIDPNEGNMLFSDENEIIKTVTGYENWLANIEGQCTTFCENAVAKMRAYLNNDFKLVVAFENTVQEKISNIEDFLRIYFESGGITNLDQFSKQKVKDEFVNPIWHVGKWKATGSSIVLHYFSRVEHSYSSENPYQIPYGNRDTVINLFKALSLFQTGYVTLLNYYHTAFYKEGSDQYIEFIKNRIEAPGSKLAAFQMYKNGNLKLTFAKPTTAMEFITFFGLDKLKPIPEHFSW